MTQKTMWLYKGPNAQLGQSMTELIVVLTTFLVPALLIVPVLSQMISLKQDAESSARYAAWERTVWLKEKAGYDSYLSKLGNTIVRSDAEITNHIDRRVLSQPTTEIFTSTTDPSWKMNPFMKLKDPSKKDMVVLMKEKTGSTATEPKYSTATSTDSKPPGAIASTLSGILGGLSKITSFDLNQNGYVKASYQVDLIRLPWLKDFDLQDLSYKTSNTLLTDAWNPTGKGHATSRVRGLLPQAALPDGIMNKLQEGMSWIPWFKELDSDSLILGHATVDPVPAHRLTQYK